MHLRGVSLKSISRQTSIRRNTVKGYVRHWQSLGSPEGSLALLSDGELSLLLLSPPKEPPGERYKTLDAYLGEHLKELSRKGVTRRLLWEEYLSCHSDGYGYTQFLRVPWPAAETATGRDALRAPGGRKNDG